jgi:hypothetical protein
MADMMPDRLLVLSMARILIDPPTMKVADKTPQSLATLLRRPVYQLCLEPKA